MGRKQKSRQRQKVSKKKRRSRRFWREVTASRYEKILDFARRFTKNISDAHDLAQTVVWRLLKYCPPVRVIHLDAYIWVSTRNAALDLRRANKEISFSDLRKADAPQIAVLDPHISRFLAECDLQAIAPKNKATNPKLLERRALVLQIRILVQAGHKLPAIAKRLNQPLRRIKYYWYQERQALKMGVHGSRRRTTKVSGAESRRPARKRRVRANAPVEDVP